MCWRGSQQRTKAADHLGRSLSQVRGPRGGDCDACRKLALMFLRPDFTLCLAGLELTEMSAS